VLDIEITLQRMVSSAARVRACSSNIPGAGTFPEMTHPNMAAGKIQRKRWHPK
jgi:hypothetical protein